MNKRGKLIEILEDMSTEDIIEVYNIWHDHLGDGEEIEEQDDSYWDNCNEDRSTLMHLVDDNQIDLNDEYVIHNGDYYTLNGSEVFDYVNVGDLADWLLEKPERLEECGISLEITLSDIYTDIGKVISGLTKIFPMLEEKDLEGIRHNLQNQISALSTLKKEVEEKAELMED